MSLFFAVLAIISFIVTITGIILASFCLDKTYLAGVEMCFTGLVLMVISVVLWFVFGGLI